MRRASKGTRTEAEVRARLEEIRTLRARSTPFYGTPVDDRLLGAEHALCWVLHDGNYVREWIEQIKPGVKARS
jgi:hypothetical protein